MSKHTAGPWSIHPRAHLVVVGASGYSVASCSGHTNSQVFQEDLEAEQTESMHLVAAAPDLLESLEGMLENEHQRKFESWLSSKSPSGDCDSVQSQWVDSGEYLDFLDSYEDEIKLIAKAKGVVK